MVTSVIPDFCQSDSTAMHILFSFIFFFFVKGNSVSNTLGTSTYYTPVYWISLILVHLDEYSDDNDGALLYNIEYECAMLMKAMMMMTATTLHKVLFDLISIKMVGYNIKCKWFVVKATIRKENPRALV